MQTPISEFFRDMLHQIANPFGRPGQRIANRAGNFAFQDIMNSVLGQTQAAGKGRNKVSTRDAEIDDIVKNNSLKTAAHLAEFAGGEKPKGMGFEEATLRAFIKISEKSGLTLEQIKALLKNQEADPQTRGKDIQLSFKSLSDDAAELFAKIKDDFTSGNIVKLFPEIEKEQSKSARKQRAKDEADAEAKNNPPFVLEPSDTMNRALDGLAEMLGGKTLAEQKQREEVLADGTTGNKSIANVMEAFSDLMGIAKAEDDLKELAGKDLKQAIDKLVTATIDNTKATAKDSQTSTSGKKKSWMNRAFVSATRWLGKNTAKVGIRGLGAVSRGIMGLVPRRFRAGVQTWGANRVAGFAQNLGVSPVVAARFGAALGTAAPAMMILSRAVPAVGVGLSIVISKLRGLANAAWAATQSVSSYNANLAYASALLDFNREMRKIQSANTLARGGFVGTGKDRVAAEDAFERTMQPLMDEIHVISNDIGIKLLDIATGATYLLSQFFGNVELALSKIVDWLDFEEGQGELSKNLEQRAMDLLGNNQNKGNPIGGLMGLNGQGAVDQEELARRLKNRPRNAIGPMQ